MICLWLRLFIVFGGRFRSKYRLNYGLFFLCKGSTVTHLKSNQVNKMYTVRTLDLKIQIFFHPFCWPLSEFLTWLAVALFHPDVAIVLCHASLRVQEGHPHAALGTETGIVAATVFNGFFIKLVTQPESRKSRKQEHKQLDAVARTQPLRQKRTQQNASSSFAFRSTTITPFIQHLYYIRKTFIEGEKKYPQLYSLICALNYSSMKHVSFI